MDLTRLEISRRTALLTSAAIAANVVNPFKAFAQETPRKGGILGVHLGSEQRVLNPAIQASTGVYVIGAKIGEPLVDLDAGGKPVGVLAESWEARRTARPTPSTCAAASPGMTASPSPRRRAVQRDGVWKKILNYGTTLYRSSTRSRRRTTTPRSSNSAGRCRRGCCCGRCRTSAT